MAFDPFQTAVEAAQQFGVDPQLALNVLQQESSGRHYNDDGSILTSPAGAMGYMQVKPSTGQDMGYDVTDPTQNIYAGVKYLGQQVKRFGSNALGAAAYNAGPGSVARAGGVPDAAAGYVSSVVPGGDAPAAPAAATQAVDPSDPDHWGDAPTPARQPVAGTPAAAPAEDPDTWGNPPPSQAGGQGAAPQLSGVSADGRLIDPRNGKPFVDDVQSTWRSLTPLLDAKAERGSASYPFVTATPDDVGSVKPGQYYIDGTQKGAPYLKKGDPAGLNIARDQEVRTAAAVRGTENGLSDFTASATAPFNALMSGGIGYLTQGAYNAGANAFGAPVNVSAGQRAEAAYEASKLGQAARDRDDPVLSTLGQIGGGFALGGPVEGAGTAAASGLMATAPRLAAGGGVLAGAARIAAPAAVYGAANADGGLKTRAMAGAENAGVALATAGLLHRTAPVVAKVGGAVGLGKLATGAGRLISNATGGALLPGLAPGAETAANQQAAGYLSRIMAEAGMTPAQIMAGAQPLQTAAEAIGPNAVASTAALARDNGTTAKLANDTLVPRATARADRLMGEIGGITGLHPALARGDVESYISNGAANAKPLYDAVRADPNPVWSPRLQQIADTPVGKAAVAAAHTNLLNDPDHEPLDGVGLVLDHQGNPGIVNPTAPPAPADPMDQALNVVRSGRTVKANSGPSLISYLSQNGGLNDDGGELSAMDADRWHLGQPFRRRLIQDNGMGLEAAAEKAHGAGYFPDVAEPDWLSGDNTQAVTGDHLLDAIRGELAGQPRYAAYDQDAADLRDRANDAGELIDHLGLDPQQFSNDQLKQSFAAHFAGRPPPSFAPPPAAEPGAVTLGSAPTMAPWDTVKRTLDQQVERDQFGHVIPDSQSMGNANINKARKALVGELRNVSEANTPGAAQGSGGLYGQALDAGGDYIGARNAYSSLSGKLFNGGFGGADMQRALDGMEPNELAGAKSGVLGDIYNTARRGLLTPRLLNRGDVQDKLGAMFGPSQAGQIADAANREAALAPAESFIPTLRGSPTAALLGQAGDQSSGGSHSVGGPLLFVDSAADAATGNWAGAGVKLAGAAFAAAQKGAQKMPVGARNIAGARLLGAPQDMVDFVKAHTPVRKPLPTGLFGAGVNAILGPHLWQAR